MNYNLYKGKLIEYLQLRGIKEAAPRAMIHCFNPSHTDDNTPSCQLSEDHFHCYGCGIDGDIYDACEIIDGIKKKSEQFKKIESVFNGTVKPSIYAPAKNTTFIPDPTAEKRLESYLSKNKAAKQEILTFLNTRAISSTNKQIAQYPDEIRKNLAEYFFYWPGYDAAEEDISFDTLYNAGIPGKNPNTGISSWSHPGVIVKLGTGYKLHFYQNGFCEKRGSRSCSTFPMPGTLQKDKPVILVEGELDALACTAAGIPNVYSAGGVNGITKPKVKQYLLNTPEIIIFFDNDTAGRKAAGIEAGENDEKQRATVPDTLHKAGYTGIIKIARFKKDCPYKDQDAAVIAGKADLIKEAIEKAEPYRPLHKKPNIRGTIWERYETITLQRLVSLLKKIKRDEMDDDDVQPFITAAVKSCRHPAVRQELLKWGATAEQIEADNDVSPYFLLETCERYGISKYLKIELQAALLPGEEIVKNINNKKILVSIDYKRMEQNENMNQFLQTNDVRSAARTVADVLQNRLIYVKNEKENYFFDGHIWIHEPDAPGMAYEILAALLKYFFQNALASKRLVYKLLTKIGGRRFRVELAQDLNGLKPEVFRESVQFDGQQIRETLTMLDGVVDFSGKEIEYKKSQPDEYRRQMLPYKIDDIKNSGIPEKFMQFMNGNFSDKKTLNTLLDYLSLIPSRNTSYKYGGIFLGRHNTGKSTTLNLIEAVFTGMTTRVKSDVLVSTILRRQSGNEATPEIAKMEGMCASFVQETARNAYLKANFWKEITGGDTLSARGLYEGPHNFIPTSQIIIASNYSPNFDAHDEAAISRMIVIPFKIQHSKSDKNFKTSNDFINELRPEFPAVIKMLIERYINLHINLHGEIPLSEECENYKGQYVEEQETDLDKFVNDCIEFDLSHKGEVYEKVQTVYERYLAYYGLTAESKEALSRNKFTRYLKRDYIEINYKQKKIDGYPELCFFNVKLKDDIAQTPQPPKIEVQKPDDTPPDDNPFPDEPYEIF